MDLTERPVDAVQLGRAIAATRAERGLKRGQLADAARVSYPYLSELENGTKHGSTQKIGQIAAALGLTPSQLLARAEALARGAEPAGTSLTGGDGWGGAGSGAAGSGGAGSGGAGSGGAGWRADGGAARHHVEAPEEASTRLWPDDTRAAPPTLRPLGRTWERTEEIVVERVTRAVRAEIERWLDLELEPAVREQVRAVLGRGSETR